MALVIPTLGLNLMTSLLLILTLVQGQVTWLWFLCLGANILLYGLGFWVLLADVCHNIQNLLTGDSAAPAESGGSARVSPGSSRFSP